MQCHACHHPINAGTKFCGHCGALQSAPRQKKGLMRAGIILAILLVLIGGGFTAWIQVEAGAAREVALRYLDHLAKGELEASCQLSFVADAQECLKVTTARFAKPFAGATFQVEKTAVNGWQGFFEWSYDLYVTYSGPGGQGRFSMIVEPDSARPVWYPIFE